MVQVMNIDLYLITRVILPEVIKKNLSLISCEIKCNGIISTLSIYNYRY